MAAANVWIDEGLVFTTETGGKVDPRNFLRVIEKAAATAKVEGVGVHTLRHSAATMWLESGIHIKQVADLLGHDSTSITGDIYGHGSDDGARRAIEKLGLWECLKPWLSRLLSRKPPGGTGVYGQNHL
jgi:integrase